MEYIKIHGLQRSGTNYLSYLVNENFENTKVLVNLNGWKHGHYIPQDTENHILIIIKNPYSWLVSVYDYWGTNRKFNIGPDLTGVSFQDFVTNRVYLEAQKDIPYLIRASNPIQHWNNMNFHWLTLRLSTKCLFVVKYESLLENKERCLEKIGEAFGLTRKPNVECDHVALPSDEEIHLSDKKWNKKDFYKNEEFLNMYTPEILDYVNNQLDLDLMIGLGYEYKGVE